MPNSTRTQQSARVETGVNWRILEKTNNMTPRKLPNWQKRKNTDTITNLVPMTTRETNANTDIDYGRVSKSAEPAISAPCDSSTLRTIPRIRELSLMHL